MPEFTNMNCFTCFCVGFNKFSWQERAEGDSQHLLSTSYVPGTLHAAFHLSLTTALQAHQLCPCLTDQETGTQKNNFSKATHLVTELGVSSLRLLFFFFFLSQKLPFYLFIFGCAGSSLLCRLFSSCREQGLLTGFSVKAFCSGFSCGAQAAGGVWASVVVTPWLQSTDSVLLWHSH